MNPTKYISLSGAIVTVSDNVGVLVGLVLVCGCDKIAVHYTYFKLNSTHSVIMENLKGMKTHLL